MPRTKVAKRNAKRARSELDESLQEFDQIADTYMIQLEEQHNEALNEMSSLIYRIRNTMPEYLRKMKMSELQESGMVDLSGELNIKSSLILQSSIGSQSTLILSEHPTRATTSDDGYSTYGDEKKSSGSLRPPNRALWNLALAKKRRSRSASNICTPQPVNLLIPNKNGPKRMTPMSMNQPRESRSRFRTPVLFGRPKASSASRIITPKVQLDTPLAIVRHARAGETVFSLGGSPVITASVSEATPNVNIPMGDAVLSLRPNEMGSIDPSYVRRIHPQTIADLRKLQENLNRLMQYANSHKQT